MSTKILLCDKIERLPFYSAENDGNGIPVPKAGKAWIIINEANGQFVEDSNLSGSLVIQKLDLVCELSPDESNTIRDVPHIFRIQFSDGSTHIWGSTKIPVTCKGIKGSVLHKQVSLERTSTVLEF